MSTIDFKKHIDYLLLSFPFFSFLLGFFLSTSNNILIFIFNIVFFIVFETVQCIILKIRQKDDIKNNFKDLIIYSLFLGSNILFSFALGITLPIMESLSRINLGLVMIPLLTCLHYIIIRQFESKTLMDNMKDKEEKKTLQSGKKIPIIEFEGKEYSFSIKSIILFVVGAPLLAWFTYFFFDQEFNYWLHEIVVKQTIFLLNLLFDMGVKAVYNPIGKYHWYFDFPSRSSIYFETFCTGIQAINTFVGIIVFIPHSLNKLNNKDIIWRKTKALVVSSVIFYLVNILRMVIQLYLYHIGYAWDDIHVSISAASSFIAAIIVLLLHKWIPEFIISIIFTGTLVYKKLKSKSEKENIEVNSNK